ncbi:protein-tyrosine phosphatase-like protein [Roridomyces roridus]|uniref:protein-tyrosine-phosphatase n=1 Tax=Roridomyces roridus TaxID=1738132 RepID=A0AAD7FFE3_9AGAR|nr:protein-tyrosine phosphatase-like protein [Roridomyces roridus]
MGVHGIIRSATLPPIHISPLSTTTMLPSSAPSFPSYWSPNPQDLTEVLPNLFLGSDSAAQNVELLRTKGITHILSVLIQDPARTEELKRDDFKRMNIPVQDWPDQELLTHFKPANSFIDDARIIAGQGVLVHCHMGVSRSATVVAAYLMASYPETHHNHISAITFLKSRRPIVQPNSGFVDQLALYGRCDCNMDDHSNAVEAWRAVRHRAWESRVDRINFKRKEDSRASATRQTRQRGSCSSGRSSGILRRISQWAVCVFG